MSSTEIRKLIDIVDQSNRTERTLLQITSLGIGFQAKGALIATEVHKAQGCLYVVCTDASLSDGDLDIVDALGDDESKINKLTALGILRVVKV